MKNTPPKEPWEKFIDSMTVALIGALFPTFCSEPARLSYAASKLGNSLRSGAAILSVANEVVDLNNKASLGNIAEKLYRLETDDVFIELKHANGNEVIRCQISAPKALKILGVGTTFDPTELKRNVDTTALAKLCKLRAYQFESWTPGTKPQSSTGDYHIKTDGAVAVGTLEGEVRQIRFT